MLLAWPALAWSNEVCYTPTFAINEQYNSNVLLAVTPENVREDYISILSPGLELSDRSQRFDSLLSLHWDDLLYSRNNDLNSIDQHYNGSVRYAATERLRFSADAGYQKVSNPSLGAASAPPAPGPGTIVVVVPSVGGGGSSGGGGSGAGGGSGGGGNAASSGTSVAVAAPPLVAMPVESVSASAGVEYQISELASLSAMYRFGWDSYEQPQYRDSSHDAQAGLVVDMGRFVPRLKGRLNAEYSQYQLPNTRTINAMGTVGFSYDMSEKWSLLADGGYRRTDTETSANILVPFGSQFPFPQFIVVQDTLDQTTRDKVGHFALNYTGLKTGAELSYTHDFTMAYLASGHQAPAERKEVSAVGRYSMTGRLSFLLKAWYADYSTDHVFTQSQMSVSPSIRYDLTRDLALDAYYERLKVDYAASGIAHRDLFFIRLSVRFPYCSSCQYR